MWKYFVIGVLLLQSANAQPAKQKTQDQQQSAAPSVSPAPLNERQVEAGDNSNGASDSQQTKQYDETKAFQRTQIRQYWVLVFTSVVTVILLIAYTIFAGLQWWQIKKQAAYANEQVGKMQLQLDAINKQEGHLADQAEAAKTQSEVMARQEALTRKQTAIMDKTLVYGTRAYVGVREVRTDFRGRRIFINIENVGKVPARDIRVVFELQVQIPRNLLPATEPPKGWSALGYDPENWAITIPFLHAYGKRTKLFPGKILEVITFLEKYYFSIREILLLAGGDAGIKIRIRGEVRYSDGFHSNKVTDFDFRYSGGLWIAQRIDEPMDKYPDAEKPENDYNPS